MFLEFARFRSEEYCQKHKCTRITVNKQIEYQVHWAYNDKGFIIRGPLPGTLLDRYYPTIYSAQQVIENHHTAIEQELERRQMCLPM